MNGFGTAAAATSLPSRLTVLVVALAVMTSETQRGGELSHRSVKASCPAIVAAPTLTLDLLPYLGAFSPIDASKSKVSARQ